MPRGSRAPVDRRKGSVACKDIRQWAKGAAAGKAAGGLAVAQGAKGSVACKDIRQWAKGDAAGKAAVGVVVEQGAAARPAECSAEGAKEEGTAATPGQGRPQKRRLERWKIDEQRCEGRAPGPEVPRRMRKARRRLSDEPQAGDGGSDGTLAGEGKHGMAPSVSQSATPTPTDAAAAAVGPRPTPQKAPRHERRQGLEASERLASEALASGDASLEAVRRVLEMIEVPASGNRKNVIPTGQTEVRGLLFGLYSYGGSFGITAATLRHPCLAKLLVAALRAQDPDFPFTAIQLNYNYASRPHIDKNNLGCSYIVGFGGYEGGGLWVQDEAATGDLAVEHTMDPTGDDVSTEYLAGERYLGRVEDINQQWVEFDGNKLHFTLPFTGTRYSLVYFVCDQYAKVPNEVRLQLGVAGFDFDWARTEGLQEAMQRKMAERTERRRRLEEERGVEAARERLRRGRCVARIWADGWGEQCSGVCSEGHDMCVQHVKGERWKTHGRFGGALPPAKREEMAKTQRKWLKQGKQPPQDEPWTRLVEWRQPA